MEVSRSSDIKKCLTQDTKPKQTKKSLNAHRRNGGDQEKKKKVFKKYSDNLSWKTILQCENKRNIQKIKTIF